MLLSISFHVHFVQQQRTKTADADDGEKKKTGIWENIFNGFNS